MFQGQELCELPANNPCRDVMCSKGVLELRPGELSARRKHSHMIVPPCAYWIPELLSCKSCLIIVIVGVQGELGLYGSEPAICFQ